MTREEMARKLYEGAGSPEGYLHFDPARYFWLDVADVALAECAKAGEVGFREGWSMDPSEDHTPDVDEDADWQGSANRAKWGTP